MHGDGRLLATPPALLWAASQQPFQLTVEFNLLYGAPTKYVTERNCVCKELEEKGRKHRDMAFHNPKQNKAEYNGRPDEGRGEHRTGGKPNAGFMGELTFVSAAS